ncbi:MAG: B12-binding domain-containing protein [Candidatus Nanopelagicales bacterium]|jgi:methanogenic corrinoid protein MtbC1
MTVLDGPAVPDQAREDYLDAVRHGSRAHAVEVCLRLLADGVPAADVLVDVVAASQSRVGLDWELGRWSVAREHRATAIADTAISAVVAAAGPQAYDIHPHGRVLVLSPEDEWHTLQARLAAEVMRLSGTDATLVTPSLPSGEIRAFLADDPAYVVAVPCALPWNLVGAWRTISALRDVGAHVLCGGRGYGDAGAWVAAAGGDEYAADLRSGASAAVRLLDEPPASRRTPTGDDVVRLELAQLRRDGPQFVEHALQGVTHRWPAFWHDVDATVQVREDLEMLLRTVAATVLVGDERLIVSLVGWFERVVATRGQPLAMVSGSLVLLHESLPPRLERARRAARAGLEACSQAPY